MRQSPNPPSGEFVNRLSRRHLLIGWTGLLIFLALGIALELLHGFKADYYLDTRNTTRRLMWTLAHTHGTLFSLVNIAFAVSLSRIASVQEALLPWASRGLFGALLLMPLGFFLGGWKFYGGDPGLGILLVPIGAALLLLGVSAFLVALVRSRL